MPGGSDTDQPEPTAGALLVATPAIGDGIFARCVALLLQHDEEGTLGVVLTGPRGEAAAPVLGPASGRAAPPAVVFTGGPVQPEVLVVVGVDPDGRTGWVSPAVGGPLPAGSLRVFSGYAGWAPGQLASEIAAGGWWVLAAQPGDLLSAGPDGLWRALVRRLPAPLAFAATLPIDATHN